MKIVWRALIGLLAALIVLLLLLSVFPPLARGWSLHHRLLKALDEAESVQVVEHSDRWDKHFFDPDYKEIVYASIELKPDQKEGLRRAFPPSLDYSGYGELMCIFEEHHYIKITEKDGSILTLHICFHCGQIILNDEGDRIMPIGWSSTLGKFIASIGLHPDGPWDKYPEGPK
jgi:hypothetical protein